MFAHIYYKSSIVKIKLFFIIMKCFFFSFSIQWEQILLLRGHDNYKQLFPAHDALTKSIGTLKVYLNELKFFK